jgi:hypothetical protein
MKFEDALYSHCPGTTFFQLAHFVVGKEPTAQARMHRCLEEVRDRRKSVSALMLQIDETNDQNKLLDIEMERLDALPLRERSIRERQLQRKVQANHRQLDELISRLATLQEEEVFLKQLYEETAKTTELKPWGDYGVQLEYWNAKLAQEIEQRLILNAPVDMEVIKTALALPEQAPIKQSLVRYVEVLGHSTSHQALVEEKPAPAEKPVELTVAQLARKYVSLAYGHVFIDNCHAHVPAAYDETLARMDDYPFMERVEKYLGFGPGGAGSFRGNVLKADIKDVEKIMECMVMGETPPKFPWIYKIGAAW